MLLVLVEVGAVPQNRHQQGEGVKHDIDAVERAAAGRAEVGLDGAVVAGDEQGLGEGVQKEERKHRPDAVAKGHPAERQARADGR